METNDRLCYTHSGLAFDPLNPDPASINIEDIAHGLSLQCRYNGAVRRFYSVAEHCVLLSYSVTPENALWALLHDATETYIGDMIFPLKALIPQFRVIEDGVMRAVCSKFGLDPTTPKEVKEHDLRICQDERAELMAPPQRPWSALEGVEPLGVTVTGLYPQAAEDAYLLRFRQLTVNP